MTNNAIVNKVKTHVAVFGVPIDDGAVTAGPGKGPAALRAAGLVHRLEQLGYKVTDHGDLIPSGKPGNEVDVNGSARNATRVADSAQALSRIAYNLISNGALPIFLGGDHSISMGTVNGVAAHFAERGRKLFVLWLDAHTDYNTPLTTPTGNMHGMPLALLCGEPSLDPILGSQQRAVIDPSHVWVFGTRAVDPEEGELLRSRGVNVVDMTRLKKAGPENQIKNVLDIVAKANGALHLSFDIDFLDPVIAPGVSTPVPEGATYGEARLVMEMLNASQLVSSLDIVELDPTRDLQGKSASLMIDLVTTLFGKLEKAEQNFQPAE